MINPTKEQGYKTQAKWIAHFNQKGEKMIDASDIYLAIKNKDTVLESLKRDFKDRWIVTSTQVDYSKNTITHNKNSKIVKEKVISLKEIPVLQGNFKEDSTTEKYLQALFDTNDKINEIITVLKSLDTKHQRIRLWTPNNSLRKNKEFRSVRFDFNDFGRFYVVADGLIDCIDGLSRGVSSSSAPIDKDAELIKSFWEEFDAYRLNNP
jgi:hypothetical protein